jgi:uncharacterized protein with LGFP repeats
MLDRWAALDYERGSLKYPQTDTTRSLNGLYQRFQQGMLYSATLNGPARLMLAGPILDEYGRTGWENGFLGFPVSDQIPESAWCPNTPGRQYVAFEHGYVEYCPNRSHPVCAHSGNGHCWNAPWWAP